MDKVKCITIGDQVRSMVTQAVLLAGLDKTPKSLNSKELKGRGACAKVPKPPRAAGCLKS